MSDFYSAGVGNIELEPKRLTTTNVTDLLGPLNGPSAIINVHVSNNSGSSVSFDLELYDVANTTSYYLWKGKVVPANDALDMEVGPLNQGWKLRGQASAADLHVMVLFTMPSK